MLPRRKSLVSLTCLIVTLSLCSCAWAEEQGSPTRTSNANRVTNYETPGNLKVTTELDCKAATVTSRHTPADLYAAMEKCLKVKNYVSAAQYFAIAGAYAKFDSLRVADKTAHQANAVLTRKAMSSIPQIDREKFAKTLHQQLEKGSNRLKKECNRIRRIGVPSYFPEYMIAHGMGSLKVAQTNKGLVKEFSPEAAMEKALKTYLHCE